ncbi:MAG TPA: Rieske 2Fe-2S domain-containing protein [Alphaproteobacteria bacterium]|nr:Rieske 2Fe-2S domain-containing protein [Alphaproteobacteria bacterium]
MAPLDQDSRLDIDIASTAPGTPGGKFMRQFWIAIDLSQNLKPGQAKPIRIMSEDYALYRGTSGRAQVIAYRCPHRGAQMHLGWVEGDDIRCVYHGWKFDCSGQCNEQPAEEAGFARKVKMRTWPTREHMGLIYAYFGPGPEEGGEPPHFPPYPAPKDEGLIDPWPVELVPCNYLQSFENSMDEVHVAFVHAPGGSHKLMSDLPLISGEETDWGMKRFGKRANGKVRVTLHYAPATTRVIVPPLAGMDGVGGWTEIYLHFTPIDDVTHMWIVTSHVKVTGAAAEAYRAKRMEYLKRRAEAPDSRVVANELWAGKGVFADVRHPDLAVVQDIAVQAGQGRIADRENERLGRSDNGIILWRKILMRELRAIADGRPPKTWRPPPADVVPEIGI